MMTLCLILGLVTSALGACSSASFRDSTTLPAAPVFPTAIYGGTLPSGLLEDHYGEVAKIGAYRPPRIVPCAQPLRTGCAHLSSGLKNWHDRATWNGTIPTSGSVTLPFNTRVLVASCSIDPNTIWDRITIPLGSELVFADAPISIKIKSMLVIGKLTIGTPTCRLQNKINIEIGPGIRAIDQTALTKGIVINGTADIHGVEYAPTWTRLAATAAVGSSVLFVQDLVNWEVGQQILITTTELKDSRDYNHNEVKVISKVERTSKPQVAAITLTTPLAYGHYGGPEYQAEVALLSRRIKIQGDALSEPTDTANKGICTSPGTQSTYPCSDKYLTGFGGHVLVIGSVASGRFEGIELYRMGQTNMIGRYPLHFHQMGDLMGTDRALFRDNSVHHSFFRCYAVHGTHGVQVSRNVAYDATGHCYFVEDGIEENNTFTFNFASHIHPLGPIENPSHGTNKDSWWSQGLSWYPETTSMVLPSDMSAAGFYITNPHNDFIGNAASGGWTGFALPSLKSPVKLYQNRTDVVPKNRPFRSPFRGNSAHSSGFWWNTAGAFYVGGELRHTVNGSLEYTAGRSASKDTCSDRTSGSSTAGASAGCYDQLKQVWLRFEDNKAFLANRGLQNWGDRSELIRFEFHNVNLAMNVFGKVLIDQLLMECRTQPETSLPTWFSGCNTSTASGVAPRYGTCNQRDIQFWTGYSGFQWYDVGQMHILTNSTFRNCPDRWSKCAYNSGGGGANSDCGGVTVFTSLTHSDQFVPQMQQLTSGVSMQNCGKKWGFSTKLSGGGEDTVSGRLQAWVDVDGTVSGTGVRTMLGSQWAGDWWKYNNQCTFPNGTTEFWVCPMKAKDSYVSMFFAPGKAAPVNNQNANMMPASVGVSNCLNGGQSRTAGTLCPIIGQVTHFGRAESTGIKLALNGKITGPLVGCSGGWYVRFNTSPQILTITQFQISKEDTFILAIPYPVGTTFTIAYKGATWCGTSWSTCTHPVTQTSSLSNVRNGFGDLYYWDNTKGILYLRVVQRAANVGSGRQADDQPYTSVPDAEVTFARNDLAIIESASQSYLQINAIGTMAAVNPGVPAAFDSACNAVPSCPTDGVWISINAGASRIIPCGSGYYGTQSRRCGSTGLWEAVVRANCKVGNAFCPANNGWEVTPPGILAQKQCACGQTGTNTRQCNSNGIWASAVNSCVTPATCTDKIQNGAETGVDCGGSCAACTYCSTISCGSYGTCVEANPPTCKCSGNWTGTRCDTPPTTSCASLNCGTNGVCQNGACVCNSGYNGAVCASPPPETCSDGIKNQDEINIDCGGTRCTACPTYSWIATLWTTCSESCGGGTHTRNITCEDNSNQVVDNSLCGGAHTLDESEACNQDPCPTYSWKTGAYGTCSAKCGTGSSTRRVDCISSIGSAVVNSSLCSDESRPESKQVCNTEACVVPRWVASEYTPCTVSCGGGSQTRSVDCLHPDDTAASADQCTDDKPVTTQACNVVICATYSWKVCPTFYPCTAQCNGGGAMVGVQYRDVFCFKDQDLSAVDASLCTDVKPTSAVSVCNPEKCTKPNWMADANWGPCTQGADGVWTRNRTFHCHNADGTTTSMDVCKKEAGPLPVSVLPCSPGTCADANGCPQVQLGAVFNDCKDGIDNCSPECSTSASALADELSALGMKSALAVQCAKDLFNNLPVGFKPSQTLVDEISAALSVGKLNVCASISGSGAVVASWAVTIGAFAMAMFV